MSLIDEQLTALTGAIKAHEDYQRYECLEKRLEENPELRRRVDEYRMKNFYLQDADVDLYDEIDHVDREFQDLWQNPLVNDYLDAELAVCRILQTVMDRICEEVKIRIPEL